MLLKTDPYLNRISEMVAKSDGSCLIPFAISEYLIGEEFTPAFMRRRIRRWLNKGYLSPNLGMEAYTACHTELGLDLIDVGPRNQFFKLDKDNVAYAIYTGPTRRGHTVALIDSKGGILYDPGGTSSHIVDGRLVGLRIFKTPGNLGLRRSL